MKIRAFEARLRAESDQERKLWAHLRAQRCGGFKSRRQHRIGPYFADFCCVAQHLILPAGSQYAEPEEERKDGLRTADLNQQGYRVMRFWNEQVRKVCLPSYLCSPHGFLIARRSGALAKDPLSAPNNRTPFSPYQGKRITAEIVQTPGQAGNLSDPANFNRRFSNSASLI
jgi:very-short-patch-repair endonuclease